jgi:hypothetical protein
MSSGGECQLILAFEVMEEAALGHARLVADVVNRSCCTALSTNNVQSRIKQLGLRFVLCLGCHVRLLCTD